MRLKRSDQESDGPWPRCAGWENVERSVVSGTAIAEAASKTAMPVRMRFNFML